MTKRLSIALCTVNATVGDVAGNGEKVLALAHEAAAQGAELVVFPEQILGGYATEDLVLWPSFIDAQWNALETFAEKTSHTSTAFVLGLSVSKNGFLYNCSALVAEGKIVGICPKERLPYKGVFYESRNFKKGMPYQLSTVGKTEIPFGDMLFSAHFGTFALEVCEDIWSKNGPMRRRCLAGAELVVNISASPYRIGVIDLRRELMRSRSRDSNAVVVYNNLVGGNDNLVFDGGGFVAQGGEILVEAARFQEGMSWASVDLEKTRQARQKSSAWQRDVRQAQKKNTLPVIAIETKAADDSCTALMRSPRTSAAPSRDEVLEEILTAVTLGLGDYYEKSRAFDCMGLALSGGRDSVLCLFIARRYFEKSFGHLAAKERQQKLREKLHVFYFPTEYSSVHGREAATLAAEEVGIPLTTLSIQDDFIQECAGTRLMFQGEKELSAITLQNIQARIRAQRMWNWANTAQALVLQTSDMSEKAVGYCTIGGDLVGGLSVIGNMQKTLVNELLEYLQRTTASKAIEMVLAHPASAELAANQESERDLMPYAVLDECLTLYVGEKKPLEQIKSMLQLKFPLYSRLQIATWVEKFVTLFHRSIYKWVQAPITLHIQDLDLDRERALQIPVIHHRWS